MSLSQRERAYVAARLRGASDAEAAQEAGYTSRAPTGRLAKLAHKALALRDAAELGATYRARCEELEAKIHRIQTHQLDPLVRELRKLQDFAQLATLAAGEDAQETK